MPMNDPGNFYLTPQQEKDQRDKIWHRPNANFVGQQAGGSSWIDINGCQQTLAGQPQLCAVTITYKDPDHQDQLTDSNGYYYCYKSDITLIGTDRAVCRLKPQLNIIPLKLGQIVMGQWSGITKNSPNSLDDGLFLLDMVIAGATKDGVRIKNVSDETLTPWGLMAVVGMETDDQGFILHIDKPALLDVGESPVSTYVLSYLYGHKFLINDEQALAVNDIKILTQTDPCFLNIDQTSPHDYSLGKTLSIGDGWVANIDFGETIPMLSMGVTSSRVGGDGNHYNVLPVSQASIVGFSCGWTNKPGDGFSVSYREDTPNGVVWKWFLPQGRIGSNRYFAQVGTSGDDQFKLKFQQGGMYQVNVNLWVAGIPRDSTITSTTKPAKVQLLTRGTFPHWSSPPSVGWGTGNGVDGSRVASTRIEVFDLDTTGYPGSPPSLKWRESPLNVCLPMTWVGDAFDGDTLWWEITNQDADGTYLPLEIIWSGFSIVKLR